MKTWSRMRGAAVLGAAVVGTAAFSQYASAQSATETPTRGGTATLAIGSEPTNLNPDLSTNYSNQQLGCMMYQGLIQVSMDSKILPLLARSWTVADEGTTYSFDLVNAKWHDGKPFTSDDVKFSLTEISAKLGPIFAASGRMIESVEAPAPDKVVVKLKGSFG